MLVLTASLSARLFGLVALVAVLWAALAHAPLPAQTSGDLTGVLADDADRPLPGALVTIGSPALLRGRTDTITDRAGRFAFHGLPPGSYTVTADLEGFASQQVEDVEIRLKRSTELHIQLSPSKFQDEIGVVSRTPMIDPNQVSQSQTFDLEYLETAAIGIAGRDYLGIIKQSPGVVDSVLCADLVDPNIFGSLDNENLYVLDGASMTLPNSMTWGKMVNFDAIEQISLETAGYKAEYGATTGGIISLVTKSGGDNFSGTLDLRYASSDWSENGEQFDRDSEPTRKQILSATLGGPFDAQRLWFFLAAQSVDSEWTPSKSKSTRDFEGHNLLGKLAWQMTPSWSLVGQYSTDPVTVHNFNASPWVEPEATSRWKQGGPFTRTELTGILSRNQMWSLQASSFRGDLDTRPESDDWDTIGHLEFVPSGIRSVNATLVQDIDRSRDTIQSDWTLMAGSNHTIKTGLEYARESQRDERSLVTGYEYRDAHGKLYGLLYVPPEGPYTTTGNRVGAFAQDSWRILPRLNLYAGLRWDRATQENNAGRQVSDLEKIQPRLGLTWQITGDGKTSVRASWGRFMHPNSLQLASFDRAWRAAPEFYYLSCSAFDFTREECQRWHDGTLSLGDHTVDRWIGDPGGLDPAGFWLYESYENSREGITVDPGLRPMFAEQLVLGVEREFAHRSSIEISYVDKAAKDIFEDTCSDNFPVPSAEARCKSFTVANLPHLERTYEGWILRVESRAKDWFRILGSYTRAKSLGNVESRGADDDFDLYPQHWENRYGYLGDDRRHRARLNGYFLLPGHTTIAFEAAWMSEFPYTVVEPIYPWGNRYHEPRGNRRAGQNSWLNLQLSKSFEPGRARLTVIGTVLNLLDDEQVAAVCDGYWGCRIKDVRYELDEPMLYTQPRHYEFGVRIEF
ncbi:MAG: TonB-dependent receptor [Acidobacteriota bacterium]|nr:TonB-dependent receptor [Acidobacteriota bacterium]